jgi:putative tryptophan/tyrosine transport system substrate-binding protein
VRRIGVLEPLAANDPEGQQRVSSLVRQLQGLGWTDGRNVRIDYGSAPGDASRMRAEAAKLVSLKPDLIVGASTPVVTALRAEAGTIPISFVQVVDPVGAGFVTSFARPGGNVTAATGRDSTKMLNGSAQEGTSAHSIEIAVISATCDAGTIERRNR